MRAVGKKWKRKDGKVERWKGGRMEELSVSDGGAAAPAPHSQAGELQAASSWCEQASDWHLNREPNRTTTPAPFPAPAPAAVGGKSRQSRRGSCQARVRQGQVVNMIHLLACLLACLLTCLLAHSPTLPLAVGDHEGLEAGSWSASSSTAHGIHDGPGGVGGCWGEAPNGWWAGCFGSASSEAIVELVSGANLGPDPVEFRKRRVGVDDGISGRVGPGAAGGARE